MFENMLTEELRLSREQIRRLCDAIEMETGDSFGSTMLEETIWLVLVELDAVRLFASGVPLARLARAGLPRPVLQHIGMVLEELGLAVCTPGDNGTSPDTMAITGKGAELISRIISSTLHPGGS